MARSTSTSEDDDSNSSMATSNIQCCSCLQVGGPFSDRQVKRARKHKPAKCLQCASVAAREDNCDQVVVLEDHGEEETEEGNEPEILESPPIKEEEKRRMKKLKRRRKKEKKRLKKELKKQRAEDSSQPSSSSGSSVMEEAVEVQLSDGEEEVINPQFSDHEEVENLLKEDSIVDILHEPGAENASATNPEEFVVPRKRKAPTADSAASLISNVKAFATPKGPVPAAMTTEQDEEDFRDSDPDEGEEGISLSALKQTIMGRKILTTQDVADEEEEQGRKAAARLYSTDCQISHALRKELACPICHECFLHPVTLLCGHSFCQECIQWWWFSSTANNGTKSCPTCRTEIPIRHPKSLGVNTALRACVLALLANEVQIRLEAQQQDRKGENGGAHSAGYEVLVDASADSWKTPGIPWSCRRSSVLDADDQRMQLALGIWKDATTSGVDYNPRDQILTVSLCLLQMEEDEVADGGFPRVVHEDDDEDNEQLLVSRNGGRFVHSFVRATANGGRTRIPLGRRFIPPSGIVKLSLELTSPEVASAEFISFEHEETGAVLDLKVPADFRGDLAPPPQLKRRGRTLATALDLEVDEAGDEKAYDSEEDGSHLDRSDDGGFIRRTAAAALDIEADEAGGEKAYDSEEDGSHLDRFEDDGFINDDVEDAEEEQQEEDCCQICKDGGDLMVCDGGDNFEGCGRSFHAACIHRDAIPKGDWICKECANQLDLNPGIEGHEFPMDGVCAICESDGVDLVCDGGDYVATCGNKFHSACLQRIDLPKGNWICKTCALQMGKEVGIGGYDLPTPDAGGDAIEINESESEDIPAPRKSQKCHIDPDDVIDVEDDDDTETAEFSPAKGGRHVLDGSDEEDGGDVEEHEEERPRVSAKSKAKRIVLLDDEDD